MTTAAVIDKKALLAKYIAERDKRLRADGNSQYLEVKGTLAHYLEDPYTKRVERAPKTDHVTFAFVGGGFAGLVTGARLVEAGVTDVRIIEKGGDFGGTWYWNRYPGAQCDTASMIYITGRTSPNRPSARDEALALKRALSARKYLVDRGVSPLKVMVNFASAADYITENITPEGRYQNQRVEIELVYVPMF